MQALLLLLCVSLSIATAQPFKTQTVILVTADGLRWQEVFNGVDPTIEQKTPARIPGAGREQLFPFLWGEIGKKGAIFRAHVTNGYRVSYPGYSEILTGRAQDKLILGNDPIQNPSPTVLEFVRQQFKLTNRDVALFGSWDVFQKIGEHTRGAVTINAGFQEADKAWANDKIAELSRLQFDVLPPWTEVRHDYFTISMALEYLNKYRPKMMHVALGETDDWAHAKNYTRYLDAAYYFDRCLREIWSRVDHATTTLIVATDHGRGDTPQTWNGHGKDTPVSDKMWIAVLGPDTPAVGEVKEEVAQRDIAPTAITLLGLDYRKYEGVEGKPLEPAIKRSIP